MAVGEAWAINADLGAPAYAADELRRIFAALLPQGQPHRTGAQEGIRPGPNHVTLSEQTVTVHNHVGVVYPGITTTSGPYMYEMRAGTHVLDPADGTNDRIDAIDIQVQDDDKDASGQRRVRSVYVVGTPGATPSPPALTINAFRAATIDVPAGGTPAPTLTYVAPFTVASGGILPVRDTTERPTAALYNGFPVWRQDNRTLEIRDAGGWSNIRHEEIRARNSVAGSVALNASESTIVGVIPTIPGHWNTWDLEWAFMIEWISLPATADRALTLRVRQGGFSGTLLSLNHRHSLTVNSPNGGLVTISGLATGLTGTGNQNIVLTAALNVNDDYNALQRLATVRAIRTS